MGIVPVHSGQPARSMGEALGGHGKRRRNIAPNTGPAGHGLGVNPSLYPISVGVSDALTRPHRTFVL